MKSTPNTLHEADRILFREVRDAVNSEAAPYQVAEGLESFWDTLRRDIRNDYRELAAKRFLTKDAAEWARETFKLGATIKPMVNVKAGRANIEYVPTFELFEAKAAYVLLRLSASNSRFGFCKWCDDLWIDDREGAGRKQEGFCSDTHRNAHAQREFRKRAKAAKHK